MLRRSSSLVTVSLETTDDETERQHRNADYGSVIFKGGSAVVVEIGTSNEPITGSRNRQRFRRHIIHDSSTQSVESDPLLDQNTLWFRVQGACIRLSALQKQKFDLIFAKLQLESKRGFLQTYFVYANVCGVTPFRFNREDCAVICLKKVGKIKK